MYRPTIVNTIHISIINHSEIGGITMTPGISWFLLIQRGRWHPDSRSLQVEEGSENHGNMMITTISEAPRCDVCWLTKAPVTSLLISTKNHSDIGVMFTNLDIEREPHIVWKATGFGPKSAKMPSRDHHLRRNFHQKCNLGNSQRRLSFAQVAVSERCQWEPFWPLFLPQFRRFSCFFFIGDDMIIFIGNRTLWKFNIAMENSPVIVDLLLKRADFQ